MHLVLELHLPWDTRILDVDLQLPGSLADLLKRTFACMQGDESGKDGVAEERASSSGNGAGHGLAEDEDELVSESEVLTLASVDFESASRLEFDRSRRNRVSIRDAGDPQRADEDFMRALSALMYKVTSRGSVPIESNYHGLCKKY